MTSTFYIPKNKEEIFKAFIKECDKNKKSYSSVLVELMDEYTNPSKNEIRSEQH